MKPLNYEAKNHYLGIEYLILNDGKPVATSQYNYIAKTMMAAYAKLNKIDVNSLEIMRFQVNVIKEAGKAPTNYSNSVPICPICGAEVVKIGKGYSCANWNRGCEFTIWESHKNVDFDMADVLLLSRGEKVFKINTNNEGMKYPAYWTLDKNHIYTALFRSYCLN